MNFFSNYLLKARGVFQPRFEMGDIVHFDDPKYKSLDIPLGFRNWFDWRILERVYQGVIVVNGEVAPVFVDMPRSKMTLVKRVRDSIV